MQYRTIPLPGGGKSPLPLCVIILFLISIFGAAAEGAILYVDIGNSSGTENGAGWATAYTSVQDAVDSAVNGDEIWVAAGTYTGTGEYVVEMAEGVALYGGFAGTETERSQRNWTANPTIIDGETQRKVLLGADNASLDGFTITRGGNYIYGGGMYNEGEFLNELSLSISNCSFVNNHAISGGAIYSDSADIEVTNCTFDQNGGLQGGAVYTMNSAPIFTFCIFTDNNAANRGGAMVNQSSDAVVSNCQFISNSVEYVMNASTGGAVYNQYSRSVFTNTIFRDNEADGFGGAIYTDGSGYAPTIINCTFRGNEAGDQGGAIFNKECDSVITNCILWDDSAENQGDEIYNDNASPVITYSCVDGYFPGTGNLDDNPDFVSISNLHLQEGSPCIDTATAAGAPGIDIAGHPRPVGSGYDMGAYEMPELINDDVLEDQDRIIFPAGFASLDPILSNTWVGATAMNINSSSKPITFFGKDPQGNTISTNDSLDPLVGRGQLANLTTELVPYN